MGAHEASFSTRLKARLPNIHALAFEANPYVHEHFAAELLKPEIGIDYRFSAISDHDGFSELSIPVKNGDISIGRISRIGGLRRWAHVEFEYENVVVPTLTMDTALGSSVNARSVAWIDAEGSQGEILAGGRDFFRYVTAVYIEVEDLERWSGQSLNSEIAERLAGFSLVPVMRDNLARGQFNEIYIRAETTIISAVVPSIVDYLEALRGLVTAAR